MLISDENENIDTGNYKKAAVMSGSILFGGIFGGIGESVCRNVSATQLKDVYAGNIATANEKIATLNNEQKTLRSDTALIPSSTEYEYEGRMVHTYTTVPYSKLIAEQKQIITAYSNPITPYNWYSFTLALLATAALIGVHGKLRRDFSPINQFYDNAGDALYKLFHPKQKYKSDKSTSPRL